MSNKYITKKEFNEAIKNINNRVKSLETKNLKLDKALNNLLNKIEQNRNESNNKLDLIIMQLNEIHNKGKTEKNQEEENKDELFEDNKSKKKEKIKHMKNIIKTKIII